LILDEHIYFFSAYFIFVAARVCTSLAFVFVIFCCFCYCFSDLWHQLKYFVSIFYFKTME